MSAAQKPKRQPEPPPDPAALVAELEVLLAEFGAVLANLTEAETAQRPEDSEWSLKERLGHLIDSALHHLQCFVRVQLDDILAFPGYDSAAWVAAQRYQEVPLEDLAVLWSRTSTHLLHVVRCVGPEHWQKPCLIGHDKPRPLTGLLQEYVKHSRRHMRKFGETAMDDD